MSWKYGLSLGVILASGWLAGCAQGPQTGGLAQNQAAEAQLMAQMQDLNSQLRRFDADNNELQSQVASLQQQLAVSTEEKQLLRDQLTDASRQLQQAQVASAETNQRLTALQASSRLQGGATIRANNSLTKKLEVVEVAGLEVRQDGDVIRIELPTDRVFVSGTTQLNQMGTTYLDQVAAAIRRHYPRQIVGIEGHFDSQSLTGSTYTTHQLTATQAIAVLHQLVRAGLPEKQLFTMSMGANKPRYSNGDPAGQAKNRRVEVVIYPETYDSL